MPTRHVLLVEEHVEDKRGAGKRQYPPAGNHLFDMPKGRESAPTGANLSMTHGMVARA